MLWDHEVDVVCTGTGISALASAIAAMDAGLDVLVARSGVAANPSGLRQPFCAVHPWLGTSVADPDTNDYFASLSADLGPLSIGMRDADVPVRVIGEPSQVAPRRGVEPFFGGRLRDWGVRCLESPYGFLRTRVTDRSMVSMQTCGGERVEVALVGSMELDGALDAGSALVDWLSDQMRDRSIEVVHGSTLQRIVFDEGDVVGAVFSTPDGPLAVRARQRVTVATGRRPPSVVAPRSRLTEPGMVQVGLVRQTGSRFGRIELLTTQQTAARARSTCRAVNRQLHDTLHEKRMARSPARRCREIHRYPPLG